ncbi:MAG TPA: membrane protein insertion efficiency factor YidD [Rhodospirillaceae bacterium]|nr:membrane protein insertion efficiency factor YidD [Rhodospirillaceae bacterium]HAA93191.1 membrane protein insertion efficiency factor YidD [Rhodospirillaceae bacterium]HAT36767.1 membrane protein insertion efficiency factor YidD [Rhodospirillaceae bacterium]
MSFIGKCMQGCIRAYQLALAPIMGTGCRFHPSCSCYAMEAIELHGPLKGFWLGSWRIMRCNPWGGSGHDPVPPAPHVH